jgi:hypothetical protein
MKLLSFEGYKMLNESSKAFEADLDKTLNENIGAALGSPIKFTKIKNNAKKYQQALVQIAINNLDYEKKKAAGSADKNQLDVLKAANAQKNQALKDTASAISDRMDQLASTGGLKKVASIAKNKSRMAAAETALKTADGEEAKALKLKIKGLNQKVAADQQELSDYEKNADKKEGPEGSEEPNQQNTDNVKVDDGKEKGGKEEVDQAKIDAAQKEVDQAKDELDIISGNDNAKEEDKIDFQIAYSRALMKKAKLEGKDTKPMSDDIGKLMQRKQELAAKGKDGEGQPEGGKKDGEGEPKEPTTRPESGKNSKDDMIARYQKLLKSAEDKGDEKKKEEIQAKIDKLQKESEERFLDPEFLSLVESELAAFEAEMVSEDKSEYLNESVSAKFRRLMENRS